MLKVDRNRLLNVGNEFNIAIIDRFMLTFDGSHSSERDACNQVARNC